jgi:hypothetical protein
MMPPFIALPITFVGTCVANVSVAGGGGDEKRRIGDCDSPFVEF